MRDLGGTYIKQVGQTGRRGQQKKGKTDHGQKEGRGDSRQVLEFTSQKASTGTKNSTQTRRTTRREQVRMRSSRRD